MGSDPLREAAQLVPETVQEAGLALQIDLVTAEVVSRFRSEGIASILLKGPSFRRWLYPTGGRRYTDSDLLVPPYRVDDARSVLARAGFEPAETERVFDDPKHALGWRRPADGANVDLHVTLKGLGVEPPEAWRVLSPRTQTMRVGRSDVDVLDVPARLLHVALHAAQHGGSMPTTIEDLARAAVAGSADEWSAALVLARELDATGAFHRGLSLAPAGEEVAERLGLGRWVDAPPTTRDLLRAEPAPVVAGVERLGRIRGLFPKVAFVWHKAFSTEALMIWTPLASRGRAGLWAARLIRPLWLLGHLPAALVRLARAARRSRRARSGDVV